MFPAVGCAKPMNCFLTIGHNSDGNVINCADNLNANFGVIKRKTYSNLPAKTFRMQACRVV
jgi:hypothetical protein